MDVSLVIRLIDQVTAPARKVKQALGGIGENVNAFAGGVREGMGNALANANFDKAYERADNKFRQSRDKLMGEAAMALTLAAPLRAASAFEEAFADFEKVFSGPEARLEEFEDFLLEASQTIPQTASQLSEILSAAAQAGIETDNLEAFTTFTAKAATAFDMMAGDAGERFAKLRNVFQLTQAQLESLANSANHLSNTMAAKAPQILDFTNRAAGSARALNLSATALSGAGAALISAGIMPETAARGFSAFANRIVAESDKTIGAFESVGLNFETFKQKLQADAPAALIELFETLSTNPEGMKALTEMIGQDFSDDFSKLLSNPDLLAQGFKLAGDEAGYAGSVLSEFNSRSQTTNNQLTLLTNKLSATGVRLGNHLIEPLSKSVDALGKLVSGVGAFAQTNPALTSGLVQAGGALLAFGVASRVLGFVFGGIQLGAAGLLKGFESLAKLNIFGRLASGARFLFPVLKGLGTAFGGLGTAIAAVSAPMALFVAAIVAAGIALYKYWNVIKVFGQGFADGLTASLTPSISAISAEWQNLVSTMQGFNDRLLSVFGTDSASINSWLNSLFDFSSLYEKIAAERPKIITSIKSFFSQVDSSAQTISAGNEWGQALGRNIVEGASRFFNAFDLTPWAKALRGQIDRLFSGTLSYIKEKFTSFSIPSPFEVGSTIVQSLTGQNAPSAKISNQGDRAVNQELSALTQLFSSGQGTIKQNVEASVRAEVIDKRPPNVNVNAPISISGIVNPEAAGKAAANHIAQAVSKARTGALHGGTE